MAKSIQVPIPILEELLKRTGDSEFTDLKESVKIWKECDTAGIIPKIREESDKGHIVIHTIDGLRVYDLSKFCDQHVEGILYDLNRDYGTTVTLQNDRMVNDLAVIEVIKYLKTKLDSIQEAEDMEEAIKSGN